MRAAGMALAYGIGGGLAGLIAGGVTGFTLSFLMSDLLYASAPERDMISLFVAGPAGGMVGLAVGAYLAVRKARAGSPEG
jgi:hypothetical protein